MKFPHSPNLDIQGIINLINETETPTVKFLELTARESNNPLADNIFTYLEGGAPTQRNKVTLLHINADWTEKQVSDYVDGKITKGYEPICYADVNVPGGAISVVAARVPSVAKPTASAPTDNTDGAFPTTQQVIETLLKIPLNSPLMTYSWKDRGRAKPGYIKGMALVYARVYCKLKAGDPGAIAMSKASSGDEKKDALAWYHGVFATLGMDNSTDGPDTLRHLFVLLTGLGMRESSGQYSEGWDTSKKVPNTEENAEAGLFQVSFDILGNKAYLKDVIQTYSDSGSPSGFLEIFKEGVPDSHARPSVGNGDGRKFQDLMKNSPACAVELAGIALRNIKAHWGPINRWEAEVLPDCDKMFMAVQAAVDLMALKEI